MEYAAASLGLAGALLLTLFDLLEPQQKDCRFEHLPFDSNLFLWVYPLALAALQLKVPPEKQPLLAQKLAEH